MQIKVDGKVTLSYTVPNSKGGFSKVCKQTFMHIFGIKSRKKLETIARKKKEGKDTYKDKRGSMKTYKYTLHDRKTVREPINCFPRYESHYGRQKANKEYLFKQ